MSAILLENKIVHYEVLGRGRPLLFIHGWVGSWRYWVPVMQVTSATYRAYAIDLWGFGDTAKANQGYGLEQQVLLVEKFLDQMGIGKIVVIGHGFGAVIAMLFALRAPKRVDRLLLVSYPFGNETVNTRLQTATQNELADWLLDKSPQAEPVQLEASKTDLEAVRVSLEEFERMELETKWENLKKSCLFVSGENDPLVALPEIFRNPESARMPDWSHCVVMEGAGHFPMLVESSKFSRLIMDFLSLETIASPQQLQLKEEWKRRVR